MKELFALYKQPSYDQKDIPAIRKIILDFLLPEGYMFEVDKAGNMFMWHPSSKCRTLLCAHMDMVKTGDPVDKVLYFNDVLFGLDKNNQYTSCGMDDKNGVWLLMQAGKHLAEKPSMLFVAHEEGAPHTIDDWLKDFDCVLTDYDCCLVMDRANDKEIIYKGSWNDYSSLLACQFKKCNPDWRFAKGVACDADRLIKFIPSINLSIGYYGGHSKTEYTILSELMTSKGAMFKFIQMSDAERDKIDWNIIKEFNESEKKGL